MFASLIAAIAIAIALAAPHAHVTTPAHAGGAHVSALDGNGGGPPGHP